MVTKDEQLQQLCDKLTGLDLSDDEKTLLKAILRIARDFVNAGGDLAGEFDDCFEPGDAELILAYHGTAPVSTVSKSITRAGVSSSITRAVQHP